MMNRPRMRFREVIDRPGGKLGRVTAVPGPQHGWGRRGAHGASVTTTSGHADRVKVSDSRRGAGGWWPEHWWRGETLVVDRPPPLCHSACRHATISDRRGRPKMPGADGGCGLIEREDMIGPRQNGGGGDGMGRVCMCMCMCICMCVCVCVCVRARARSTYEANMRLAGRSSTARRRSSLASCMGADVARR